MRALVLCLALIATPAAAAEQFDLVCKSKAEVTRYRVDLAAREWCWEGCTNGTWRIADVTSSRIVFKDEKTDTSVVSNFVDRSSGRYSRFNQSRFGTFSSQGTCEVAPFSGFPKAKF